MNARASDESHVVLPPDLLVAELGSIIKARVETLMAAVVADDRSGNVPPELSEKVGEAVATLMVLATRRGEMVDEAVAAGREAVALGRRAQDRAVAVEGMLLDLGPLASAVLALTEQPGNELPDEVFNLAAAAHRGFLIVSEKPEGS